MSGTQGLFARALRAVQSSVIAMLFFMMGCQGDTALQELLASADPSDGGNLSGKTAVQEKARASQRCAFTIYLQDGTEAPEQLNQPRPIMLDAVAGLNRSKRLRNATLTWVLDGLPSTGFVASSREMLIELTAPGEHTVELFLTTSTGTTACTSTQNGTITARLTAWPMVFGRVLDEVGHGIPNANVATSAETSCNTDGSGWYEAFVPYGWSGSVTVSHNDYTFSAGESILTALAADLTLDFTADPTSVDGGEPAPQPACYDSLDCDDGGFCNGPEACVNGLCIAGTPPDCDDGRACTLDTCSDSSGSCEHLENDAQCDDGVFCNGLETCDATWGCVPGAARCPGQFCDEQADACADCLDDGHCDDGLFCNGAETCSSGLCTPGSVPCDPELCDENAGTCAGGAVISGTINLVVTEGASGPVGPIRVVFLDTDTGNAITTTTDRNGVYRLHSPFGSNGTVMADDSALDHCIFLHPVSRSYAAIAADTSGQDFVAWCPPVGIPTPEFGISQTHYMYADATYDFGYGVTGYPNAGNGPYTHYVDNSTACNDNNNGGFGSPTEPLCRIPEPVPAGSVVEIHGGPYTYNNTGGKIRVTSEGTAAAPVFVRGAADAMKPIIEELIVVQGQYVVFENLHFSAARFSARLLDGNVDALPHHIALRRCELEGDATRGGAGGVSINGDPATATHATDIVIYDNHIHHAGDSEFFGSEIDGISGEDDVHGVAIGFPVRNVWLLDNHIHHLGGDSVQVAHNARFTTDHVYIGRNHMHDDGENAVDIKQANDVIVSQNVMHGYEEDFGSSPGEAFIVHYEPQRIWVLNNEIYDARIGVITTGSDAFYAVGNVLYDIPYRAFDFRNSGVIHLVANTISRAAVGIHGDSGNTAAHLIDNIITDITDPLGFHIEYTSGMLAAASDMNHNLLYQGGYPLRIRWGAVVSDNVSDFMTLTGKGAGSLEVDPLFVDTGNDDFHLDSASPAVDTGVHSDVYDTYAALYGISIAVDRDSVARSQGNAHDIGAQELRE